MNGIRCVFELFCWIESGCELLTRFCNDCRPFLMPATAQTNKSKTLWIKVCQIQTNFERLKEMGKVANNKGPVWRILTPKSCAIEWSKSSTNSKNGLSMDVEKRSGNMQSRRGENCMVVKSTASAVDSKVTYQRLLNLFVKGLQNSRKIWEMNYCQSHIHWTRPIFWLQT